MRATRHLWPVLAVVAALMLVAAPAHAAKTLSLSSGTFEFDVDSGASGEGEVVVINDGDEPIKALVYVADVEIDDQGNQTYVTPQRQGAALLTTPASWFRISMPSDSKSVGNTPYIELEVGERIPIKFEFAPPGGTAPGDHNTVIFFEMFELADGSDGSVAQVSGRLGARVALRVSGQLVEKLSLRPFEVPALRIGTSIPFTFTVNNEGNLNERIEVEALVLDRSEQTVASSVISTDTALYADSSRRFTATVDLPAARIGPHTVELRVRYFEDGAQVASELVEQRTVWLVPFWVVVLIGFVVIYALGFLLVRLLRRGRTAGTQPSHGTRPAEREIRVVEDAPVVEPAAPRPSRRERDHEAEERRRRREERAAQAAAESKGAYPVPRAPEDDEAP